MEKNIEEIEEEINFNLTKNNQKQINDFLIVKYNKSGDEISRSVNIDAVADFLIQNYNFKTWFGIKNDYSYCFNGKIYQPNTREIVKVECEKILKEYCKKNVVEEIFDKVKRKTKIEKEKFETTDINFICLNNGVWDIQNKTLLPHDSKYNFQTFIPIDYDINAKCPIWDKFLEETIYPEDILLLQEWFGFLLFREYLIKKALICVGAKNTGKSVLLDTAIKFIGEINKTGISLQKITNGTDFTKLSLKNKHANIYDDLSSKDLCDGGAFKVATGGGYISGEEKFGEFQQFRSFAKQMFATNKIPPVKDNDDDAYFDRWLVLKFDNIVDVPDIFLRKKLWTNQEMSGILNWSLEGLYKLLSNGKFSCDKNSEQIKRIMEESGCPLVAFSSEVLERAEGDSITKEDMFQIYTKWCEKNNKSRMTKEMLGRQLTKYCSYILATGGSERKWLNAKIKEKWKTI